MSVESQLREEVENTSQSCKIILSKSKENALISAEEDNIQQSGRSRLLWESTYHLKRYNSVDNLGELYTFGQHAVLVNNSVLPSEMLMHREFVRTDLQERLRGGGGPEDAPCHDEGLLLAVTSCGEVSEVEKGGTVIKSALDSEIQLPRLANHLVASESGKPPCREAGALRLSVGSSHAGLELAASEFGEQPRGTGACGGGGPQMRPASAPPEPLVPSSAAEVDGESGEELIDILRPRVFASASRSVLDGHPRRFFPLSQNVKNILLNKSFQCSFT